MKVPKLTTFSRTFSRYSWNVLPLDFTRGAFTIIQKTVASDDLMRVVLSCTLEVKSQTFLTEASIYMAYRGVSKTSSQKPSRSSKPLLNGCRRSNAQTLRRGEKNKIK